MGEKEQVIQALRATLLSVKGSLTIKQCNRDYKELQGEWIPFKKLGYNTLDQLFREVPGFTIRQINGECYVDAIPTADSKHIADMVSKQKSSKKAPKNYSNRFPAKQDSWRKPGGYNNYSKPNNYQQYSKPAGQSSYYNNNSVKFNSKYSKVNVPKSSHTNNKPEPQVEQPQPVVVRKVETKPVEKPKVAPIIRTVKSDPAPVKPSGKMSASQRMSNLRERINTVDLIPLQLPAAAAAPDTKEIKQQEAVQPQFIIDLPPSFSSSMEKLEWTCQKLGLPVPVYKVHDYKAKRGPICFDCSVKVGAYSATSYPDSSPSEPLARELAAEKLLAIIEGSEAGGLVTSLSSVAIQHLTLLIMEHEAGIWASTVPHLYREKYQENLPSNWQDLVERCPLILKERVVNGLLILLPNKEENKSSIAPETSIATDESFDSDLPSLRFPDEEFWSVYVTVANSTLDIWLRFIGPDYNDALEPLLEDMNNYYKHHGTHVEKSMILQNSWYAVSCDDGGWQRGKVLEVEEDHVIVFLGDHGDDDIVSLDNIKILEPQFRKLAAQAFLCRLEGAEEVSVCAAACEAVRARLVGEALVAAPSPRHDMSDPAIELTLYDTTTHRDLNLNREIINDFCTAGAFTITQKPHEVEVGCVSEEGRVWVVAAGGCCMVKSALSLLTEGPYRRPLPASPSAPPPTHANAPLYIVKTMAGDWVRCKIISGLDGEGTVRTQLVDSGLVLRAPLSSLVPLAKFSLALSALPYQAIQVRLGAAERALRAMAVRLREMVSGRRVLCRALPPVPQDAATPPHVELFVRTGPQNILASVNNAILMEYEYLQLDEPCQEQPLVQDALQALHRKKERVFRVGSVADASSKPQGRGALPLPLLPVVDECFDVFIAMAANPWNFVVQPNSTRATLVSMMASLQQECPKFTADDAPVKPASGDLFTVYYDKDSAWYRVLIAGTVSSEMVSVYFCDFGDLALFATKALRPIPDTVPIARSLPPQAIKARLYDVFPVHQDWTVEDCIRFQELCVEQEFVGLCKEVGKDPLNPNEPLLTLDLVDTSTNEDIFLNKQLVSEGRARLGSAQ